MTPDLLITPPEFAQLVPFFQVAPLDSKLQRPGALLSAPSKSGPLGVLGVLGLYLFLKIFLLVASDRSVRVASRPTVHVLPLSVVVVCCLVTFLASSCY